MPVLTPSPDGREAQATLTAQEHAANVLRFRGALVFGFASWLAFFPFDLFVARFIEPGPIAWYAAVRAFGAVVIVVIWRATRRSPLPGPRALRLFEQVGYSVFTALCALLTIRSGE